MSTQVLFRFLLGGILLLPLGTMATKQVIAQATKTEATVEKINSNINDWVGETVTIKGTPENIQNDSSFIIENQVYFDSDRILVINRSGEPIPNIPEENITLQITGTVEKVSPTEFFAGMEVELPAELPTELRDRPGIYADSIVLAPAS